MLSYVTPQITDAQNDWLMLPVTKEELKQAVFQLGHQKPLAPDGFNGHFYQSSWEEVGDSLLSLVNSTLFMDESLGYLNSTNLTFIPKVDRPENVSHFRPISLCNFAFKVISKIIANRFKVVLDDCVSPTQMCFCSWVPHT